MVVFAKSMVYGCVMFEILKVFVWPAPASLFVVVRVCFSGAQLSLAVLNIRLVCPKSEYEWFNM